MVTMEQFQKKAKFNRKLNNDTLIVCPVCKAEMGVKKWMRLEGLTCPACGATFKNGQRFDTYQITRVPSSGRARRGSGKEKMTLKASAIATVSATDILTKAKVVRDPVQKKKE